MQGLTKEDYALLLHGIRAIYVADMETRRAKLEKKLLAELSRYGISDVQGVNGPFNSDSGFGAVMLGGKPHGAS